MTTHPAILRLIASFAAAAVVSATLVSCGGTAVTNGDQTATTTGQTTETVAEQTTQPKLLPELPTKDFGGHTFTFLLKGDSFNEWASFDIATEGENGEPINDAVYARNTYIEDTYNVKIAWNRDKDPSSTFKKSFTAGDNTYDAMIHDLPSEAKLAQEGMLYDLKSLPYIDLTKPWWDAHSVNDLSVGGKLYFAVSDISYTAIDTIWIMMFSKALVQQYQLEDPYEIVKRGEWTFDKLNEMIKGVSRDLNNDGVLNDQDLLGFVTPSDRYASAMILAAGENYTQTTPDGYFTFKQPTDNFYGVFSAAMELMHNNADALDVNKIKDQGSSYLTNKYFLAKKMFEENRILFFSEVMQNIVRLRQMDADFGIIPLPKQRPEQPTPPHYVFVETTTAIAVPSNCSDPERTGILIEAMAAESHYTLLPAYYDVSLKTKLARDTKSGEMMDLILANRTYDLVSVYSFGSLYSQMQNASIKNTSLQTVVEKLQGKIDADISKITDKYKALS